jgi:type I restriction enzyme M protein
MPEDMVSVWTSQGSATSRVKVAETKCRWGARAAAAVKPAIETVRQEPRGMTADHLQSIEKFEADLWKIADNLRANSNLASNEYFMPIMGLIFLRRATNRFYEAKAAIEADKEAGKMPDRPLVEADFTCRRALNLPESARFDVILKTPKGGNLGAALNAALTSLCALSACYISVFP